MPLLESAGVDVDDQTAERLGAYAAHRRGLCGLSDHRALSASAPVSFVREQLNRMRVTTAEKLKVLPDQKFVRVAGLVLLRQRREPPKGITFVTLEDETGSMNLVLRPDVWDRHYNSGSQF